MQKTPDFSVVFYIELSYFMRRKWGSWVILSAYVVDAEYKYDSRLYRNACEGWAFAQLSHIIIFYTSFLFSFLFWWRCLQIRQTSPLLFLAGGEVGITGGLINHSKKVRFFHVAIRYPIWVYFQCPIWIPFSFSISCRLMKIIARRYGIKTIVRFYPVNGKYIVNEVWHFWLNRERTLVTSVMNKRTFTK